MMFPPYEVFVPALDSTMDEARRRVGSLVERHRGDADALGVRTARQYAGRGRRGARWFDIAGGSLLCTVALRRGGVWDPRDPNAGTIALRSAAAVADTVGSLTDQEPQIKWPNDVLLRGRKLCGILVEADPRWFFVGIGMNLDVPKAPLPGGPLDPVGLRELDPEMGSLTVWEELRSNLARHLSGPEWHATVESRLAWRDREVGVVIEGAEQRGVLRGLAADGALILDRQGREELVYGGTLRCFSDQAG